MNNITSTIAHSFSYCGQWNPVLWTSSVSTSGLVLNPSVAPPTFNLRKSPISQSKRVHKTLKSEKGPFHFSWEFSF